MDEFLVEMETKEIRFDVKPEDLWLNEVINFLSLSVQSQRMRRMFHQQGKMQFHLNDVALRRKKME